MATDLIRESRAHKAAISPASTAPNPREPTPLASAPEADVALAAALAAADDADPAALDTALAAPELVCATLLLLDALAAAEEAAASADDSDAGVEVRLKLDVCDDDAVPVAEVVAAQVAEEGRFVTP